MIYKILYFCYFLKTCKKYNILKLIILFKNMTTLQYITDIFSINDNY